MTTITLANLSDIGGDATLFSTFNPVYDGVTDNTAALQAAVDVAIATTGKLYIDLPAQYQSASSSYKFFGLVTATAPDVDHTELTIQLDPSIIITFNAATGWVLFDSGGAGGRLNNGTVIDGDYFPYNSGSAYCIQFHGVDRGIIRNARMQFRTPAVPGSGIYFNNCFSCAAFDNYIDGAIVGILCDRNTNFTDVRHNEIVFFSSHGIYTGNNGDGIVSSNLYNRINFNYLESGTGVPIQMDAACQFNWALANIVHANSGAHDIIADGGGHILDGNVLQASGATVSPISVLGSNIVAVNTSFTDTAAPHGAGIVLEAASAHCTVFNTNFATNPTSGSFITDAGTANRIMFTNNSTNALIADSSSGTGPYIRQGSPSITTPTIALINGQAGSAMQIKAASGEELQISSNGTGIISHNGSNFYPQTTNTVSLGTNANRYAGGYFSQPVAEPVYTVGTLPGALAGFRALVSDANATTFNSIVAGSGANVVPVFYDGTNWRIG